MWNKQLLCVLKNTLSLLGCPSRVKRPFSGPTIFFKKESRLLLDKSSGVMKIHLSYLLINLYDN
jgi:hypothetical protein